MNKSINNGGVIASEAKQSLKRLFQSLRSFAMTLGIFLFLQISTPGVHAEKLEVVETDLDMADSEIQDEEAKAPSVVLIQPIPSSSSETPKNPLQGISIKEPQVIELNRTLRNVIDQNQMLRKQNKELDDELRAVRGQRQVDRNRMNTINEEVQKVRQQTEGIVGLNQKYSRQIIDMQNTIKVQEQEYQLKLKELEERLVQQPPQPSYYSSEELASISSGDQKATPERTVDVRVMIEEFNKENEQLKYDTARVYYNMGNIHFQKGEYKEAVKEYKRTLSILPSDAAAHFNLAFVSGDYLGDYKTALEHYREYLFLNPDAEDVPLVREKILQIQLELKSEINSPLDKGTKKYIW